MRDPAAQLDSERASRRAAAVPIGIASVALLALVGSALLAAALLVPGTALAAPRPGESCPDTTPAPGSSGVVCGEGSGPDVGGAGTLDLSVLLPIVATVVLAGAIALVAAFLVLRRRASAPVAPADPSEWWTCSSCGKTNVIGSPRCYACGSWQA
jgi:hypothetical protein